MNSCLWITFVIMTTLYIVNVKADCDNPSSDNSDEGEVKQWFKKVRCSIKKGAEDIQESAKPWTDKISSSAKEFSTSVAQKFDEVKHRLTDEKPSTEATRISLNDEITEKVPLAQLSSTTTADIV
uniref:Secreted protein n=1 Tax=Glossina brevipalpis TaxID=37001 RepID=A0A1A9WS68_9MUSC